MNKYEICQFGFSIMTAVLSCKKVSIGSSSCMNHSIPIPVSITEYYNTMSLSHRFCLANDLI